MTDELRAALERLPRFGVLNGVIAPHSHGVMVRLDDVLAALDSRPDSGIEPQRLAVALVASGLMGTEADPDDDDVRGWVRDIINEYDARSTTETSE